MEKTSVESTAFRAIIRAGGGGRVSMSTKGLEAIRLARTRGGIVGRLGLQGRFKPLGHRPTDEQRLSKRLS